MNFNRNIGILLSLIMLVSSIGFSFNVRYCGNEISCVSLKISSIPKDIENKCCGIVEIKSHCCKDKIFHFQKKLEDHSTIASAYHSNILFLNQNWKPFLIFPTPCLKKNLTTFFFCGVNSLPFFKLYSQYIFYA